MMTIEPREKFVIVRQLPDPSDTSTYYVQAVIRNAMTDTIIATVRLTDRTGRRFSKDWQAPADPSGQGFYISIATTVYTDSGYTTKSEIYAEEIATHLIAERYNPRRRSPGVEIVGQGGDDVDYKKIRKIMKEEIAEVKIPEQQNVSFDNVIVEVKRVGELVKKIEMPKIPEQKQVDLSPVISKIDASTKEITDKLDDVEFPEMPETDLSPIIAKLDAMDVDQIVKALDSVKGLQSILTDMKSEIPGLSEDLSLIQDKIKDFLYIISQSQPKVENQPNYTDRAKELAGVSRTL